MREHSTAEENERKSGPPRDPARPRVGEGAPGLTLRREDPSAVRLLPQQVRWLTCSPRVIRYYSAAAATPDRPVPRSSPSGSTIKCAINANITFAWSDCPFVARAKPTSSGVITRLSPMGLVGGAILNASKASILDAPIVRCSFTLRAKRNRWGNDAGLCQILLGARQSAGGLVEVRTQLRRNHPHARVAYLASTKRVVI